MWVLESVTEYLADVRWRNLAQTIQHEARMDAYANVQALDLAAFEERSTGSLLAVLNDDVNQLERFLDRGAQELLHVATSVVLIGGTYLILSPVVGLFAFLPVPLVLWVTLRYQRRLEPRYAAVREQVGVVNAALSNNLGGIATIKAFGAEDREWERIRDASDTYRQVNRRAIRLSSAFIPLVRLAILAGFIAILLIGGLQAIDGRLEVGVYAVMVFIVQRLLWPLTRLGETFDLYQRATATTSVTCASPTCVAPVGWSARTCSCSTARCVRTCSTAVRTPRTPSWWPPPTSLRRTPSWRSCPRATTRWSGSGASSCPEGNVNACPSHGRSCATRPS